MANNLLAPSVIALLLLSGCVHGAEDVALNPGEAKTPLELNSNQAMYDGKTVLVRGYLFVDENAICLVEPKFAKSDSPPRDAEFSVLGLEMLKPGTKDLAGNEIAFTAVYRSKVVPESGFLLKGCGQSGVEIKAPQTAIVIPDHK